MSLTTVPLDDFRLPLPLAPPPRGAEDFRDVLLVFYFSCWVCCADTYQISFVVCAHGAACGIMKHMQPSWSASFKRNLSAKGSN